MRLPLSLWLLFFQTIAGKAQVRYYIMQTCSNQILINIVFQYNINVSNTISMFLTAIIYQNKDQVMQINKDMQAQEEKKEINLWEEMIKNENLNNSLKQMFCYTTKDQRSYYLSWCIKKINGLFGLFSRTDILLYLQKKQAEVKLGVVERKDVKPKWNHNLGALFNFHQFIENQIGTKGQILLFNSQKENHIELCGEWDGLLIRNPSGKMTIHFESQQAYLLWKDLIVQQLPGFHSVSTLSQQEKQTYSSFVNEVPVLFENYKDLIVQRSRKKGQLLLSLYSKIQQALQSIFSGESPEGIERSKIIEQAQTRVQQIKLLHRQLQRINELLAKQQDRILEQATEISALQIQNTELKSREIQLLENYRQLEIQTSRIQVALDNTIRSKAQLALSFQTQTSENQQLRDKLAKLSQQIVCLKEQIDKEQSEKNRLIVELESISRKAERAEQSKNQKEKSIQELQLQLDAQKAKLDQIQQQHVRHLNKLQEVQSQKNKEFNALLDQEREETKKARQQADHARIQADLFHQQRFLHVFEGRVLHDNLPEKEFLTAEIERYSQRKVKMTNLLYRYDHLNTVSFHSYIDNHPHFCVVVKLLNGRLVAGYSVGALSEGVVSTEGGLIVSLSEKKCFQAIEGRRAIVFDKFFLIFGNSQLRLRQGQKSFFTNFGINNSYYECKGQKYSVLSGQESARECSLQDYQIFEVVFN